MGDEEVAATVNELQTQMTAIQAALEGNAQSGLFRQAPFCGGPNENVHEWLTKFERLSKFYNWSNAKKLGALPLLLGGTALAWFQTLPDGTINDFATLTDELKTRFGAQNLEFIFVKSFTPENKAKTSLCQCTRKTSFEIASVYHSVIMI